MMTGERAVLQVVLCLLSGSTVLSQSAQSFIGVVVQHRSYAKPKTLTPADFTLKEDGVIQKISNVHLTGSSGDANKPSAGLVVLLLDKSEFLPQMAAGNSSPNATTTSIATTISTVLRQLPVDAPVAIYSTDYQLHQVRDFTLEQGTQPIFQPLSSAQIMDASKGYIKGLISPHDRILLKLENAAKFQLAQLESIANHLANIPGRKALVWFCDPISFRTPPSEGSLYYPWFAAMRAAQRANLAIYVVSCGSSQLPEVARMAEITGGRVYFADLKRALNDAIGDLQNSYQVAWEPRGIPAQPLHKVELSQGQVTANLLYPSLYVEPVVPHQIKSRIEAAEAGLATPLSARAIRVVANITSKSHAAVSVELSIEPKDLLSGESGSPRLSGLLDVIYALYDENHVRIKAGQRNEIKLNISREGIASFLERPYKQVKTLTVPADACSLRVLVRDADSGAMGSSSVTLDCHR